MIYIFEGPDNSLIISGYHPDDPLFENNHTELADQRMSHLPVNSPHRLHYEGLRNTVTNILRDAGAEFTEL